VQLQIATAICQVGAHAATASRVFLQPEEITMTLRFIAYLALAAMPAWAQQHKHHDHKGAATQTPVPATPVARSVDGSFQSAFDGYRRFRADEPMADWQQLNKEIAALGGHAGHLRGAPAPLQDKEQPKTAPQPAQSHSHSQGGKR
jgi:hypothetical protein